MAWTSHCFETLQTKKFVVCFLIVKALKAGGMIKAELHLKSRQSGCKYMYIMLHIMQSLLN